MFETLILMTQNDMIAPLSDLLLRHNPQLKIIPIVSRDELFALPLGSFRTARLIAFTSPVVVPADRLAATGFGAYNFHPASPNYPGLAPAQFAIYEQAQLYGATVHAMVEKVDAGPIVAADFCLVPRSASVFDLESQAFALLIKLFHSLSSHLAAKPEPLPTLPIVWSTRKSSRRSLEAMCDIPLDIDQEELDRRVDAFAINHFGAQLVVRLHGYVFRLEDVAERMSTRGSAETKPGAANNIAVDVNAAGLVVGTHDCARELIDVR